MPSKRSTDRGDSDKVEAQSTITAVVLADSFTQKFRPITIERPKVLLPLINAPMLEYTLEWLASNGVEEIHVFCCAHADQIRRYLNESKWMKRSVPKVHTIQATTCASAGEAMRIIDGKDVIKGDFILVSGDTVTNINLKPILEEHRQRREKNQQAIMTLVMKPIKSSKVRWRLGDSDLLMAIDPSNRRLFKYHAEDPEKPMSAWMLDTTFFGETDVLQVRDDLMDTNIAICAPQIPMLFTDNFDFQNLHHLISGVLSEEELGNKLYIHELAGGYAARVHNLRSYSAVSRDVLQRWVFPFTPDSNILQMAGGNTLSTFRCTHTTQYQEQDVCRVPWKVHLGPCVTVGSKTMIGEDSNLSYCSVGRNCKIGKDVVLHNCYLQDNVTIQDNVHASYSLFCEGSVVKPGAQLHGNIVSFGVVVGTGHKVPEGARLSLSKVIVCQESDDELECATSGRRTRDEDDDDEDEDEDEDEQATDRWDSTDMGDGQSEKPTHEALQAAKALAAGLPPPVEVDFDVDCVGEDGAGYNWPLEQLDIARYCLLPPTIREPVETWDSDEEKADPEESEARDPSLSFKLEVTETFLRCVKMGFDQSNVVLELNGLKIAEVKTFADCARYIFTTILNLCLPAPNFIDPEYRDLFPTDAPNIKTVDGKKKLLQRFNKHLGQWTDLLKRFLRNQDDQMELLFTFEDYCAQDGVFEGTGEQGHIFSQIFSAVLQQLYNQDILTEEAIFAWADEVATNTEESALVYLNKASDFIEWLRNASEEDEDEDEDD